MTIGEDSIEIPQKCKYDPAIPVQGIHIQRKYIQYLKERAAHHVHYSTIHKSQVWVSLRVPSMEGWMKKCEMCIYIYITK
jgi:hypothetical protein